MLLSYTEAQLSAAKKTHQETAALMGDYAAHAIVHFLQHHNVDMLNHMSYFIKALPRGSSQTEGDKKIRAVALWIAKSKIHEKVGGVFAGKVANRLAKKEMIQVLEDGAHPTPKEYIIALYNHLVAEGDIVEKVEADSSKTDDQRAADKAVPKTNKAMGKYSAPVQTLLKALHKAAYGTDWVGTGGY